MRITATLTLTLTLAATRALGQGFPNVPQTPGTLLSGLNAPQQGRTAIIAYHNGILFTVPEVPSSQPGADFQVRTWNIANPAAPVQPDPGAAGLQVASSEDVVVEPAARRPARQRGGRAGMEFVAVAGQHQPPTGMGLPGEGDDAHRRIVRPVGPIHCCDASRPAPSRTWPVPC